MTLLELAMKLANKERRSFKDMSDNVCEYMKRNAEQVEQYYSMMDAWSKPSSTPQEWWDGIYRIIIK